MMLLGYLKNSTHATLIVIVNVTWFNNVIEIKFCVTYDYVCTCHSIDVYSLKL